MVIDRGQLWWADLGQPRESEAAYERPALIIQDDFINHSRIATVIIIPLTSNLKYEKLLGNVVINLSHHILPVRSLVQTHLIQALPKNRLLRYLGKMPEAEMLRIDIALQQTLGLFPDNF